MPEPAVLVLENVHQTLPIVRSLGRARVRVVLGVATDRPNDARWSRYVTERWAHPPIREFDRFAAALKTFCQTRDDIQAIFPSGEQLRKTALIHNYRFPVPVVGVQDDVFVACRDKVQANELARRAGLRVPITRRVDNLADLKTAVTDIGLPVILKPYGEQYTVAGNKATILKAPGDLDAAFPTWPEANASLLVQEYISGPVESADFVARQGQVVGYCEATSVRTDNPDGTGFGVMFKSQAPSGDLLQATRRFAETSAYDGPGIIQFIRCEQSGALYFLENNPRLSAGVATSIQWGQDIPLFAVENTLPQLNAHSRARFDEAANPYEYDSLCYWFQRDVTAYLAKRKRLTAAERGRWASDIRSSLRQANYDVVWEKGDPLPALAMMGGQVLRKAKRTLRLN